MKKFSNKTVDSTHLVIWQTLSAAYFINNLTNFRLEQINLFNLGILIIQIIPIVLFFIVYNKVKNLQDTIDVKIKAAEDLLNPVVPGEEGNKVHHYLPQYKVDEIKSLVSKEAAAEINSWFYGSTLIFILIILLELFCGS